MRRSVLLRRLARTAAALGAMVLLAGPASAAAAPSWRWPLDAPVTVVREFEAPTGPYSPGHRGVDLAAATGTPVRAAAAGTVVLAGSVAGRPVVVVAHGVARTDDELRATYEPVVAAVHADATVRAGTVIGRVGRWNGHCPPAGCLHWGLRRGQVYLDPLAMLRGPVRLLPVGGPVRSELVGVGDVVGGSALVPRPPAALPASDRADPPRSPNRGAPVMLGSLAAVAAVAGVGAGAASRRRARRSVDRPAQRGSSP